jgi:hypothetical protein
MAPNVQKSQWKLEGLAHHAVIKIVVIHAFHQVGRVWEISTNYPPEIVEGTMDLETTTSKQDLGPTC